MYNWIVSNQKTCIIIHLAVIGVSISPPLLRADLKIGGGLSACKYTDKPERLQNASSFFENFQHDLIAISLRRANSSKPSACTLSVVAVASILLRWGCEALTPLKSSFNHLRGAKS